MNAMWMWSIVLVGYCVLNELKYDQRQESRVPHLDHFISLLLEEYNWVF